MSVDYKNNDPFSGSMPKIVGRPLLDYDSTVGWNRPSNDIMLVSTCAAGISVDGFTLSFPISDPVWKNK